ncbi:MAG: hypothetical protein CL927_19040 [Deltaproteobacteria bacterium]|nr:hypothetical protein [Deltaproteobacteria bacterium]HCH65399.1 hypothetical protein [Deltaproteobacteria bacterium]
MQRAPTNRCVRAFRHYLGLAGVITSVACSGEPYDLWGVLHGDVTIRDDQSLDGVLVWEFFEAGWERRQSADDHRCGRLISIQGMVDPTCADCAYGATITTETLEQDCPGREGVAPALEAVDRLWLRPSERVPEGRWPDDRWTWSAGWEGGAPEVEGVAWDEGMEFGTPPAAPEVLVGRRIRLMATTARGFVEAELSSKVQEAALGE